MILTGIDTGGVRRVPPVQLPRDWIVPLEHPKGESGKRQNCQQPGLPVADISRLLRQFFADGSGGDNLLALCTELRGMAYDAGTPRQLLLADVVSAVVRKKYRNSSWYALPQYTALPSELWVDTLQKPSFISGTLAGTASLGKLWRSARQVGRCPNADERGQDTSH